MEVLAVSHSLPTEHDVRGLKIKTSIIHTPLASATDYIELNADGVVDNATAAHDGPVYVCLAENYDYWCAELNVDRASWGWCHWGENITFRCTGAALTERDFHLGDIWRVGPSVRLQVCGSRIPCMKLSWRCGQPDSWLKPLADSGRVGVYLRVLQGGRVHPGDVAVLESPSGDPMDVAIISKLAFEASLTTRDTLNLLANHAGLLRLNRFFMERKLVNIDDKVNVGKNAWKGWREFRPYRIVDEGGGVKSFHIRPSDGRGLANYQPGQFLTVRLPSGEVRNWSISDWLGRDAPTYYRLSIKKGGGASAWMLRECTTDHVLWVRSPAGRFVLDWTQIASPRQVYLTAGIGLTPILAMMKAHAKHPNMSKTPGVWIHVARNSEQFSLKKEAFGLGQNPIEKKIFFTDPTTSDIRSKSSDYVGRPNKEILTELLGSNYTMNPLGGAEMSLPGRFSAVYICGPSSFEADMKALLNDIGIPPPFIHSESFSPSGNVLGDLTQARVRFTKSNKSCVWMKDKPLSLLELAESLGLKPDYGCRVGACGSCAAKLVRGSVSGGIQLDGTILTCSSTPSSEDVEVEL